MPVPPGFLFANHAVHLKEHRLLREGSGKNDDVKPSRALRLAVGIVMTAAAVVLFVAEKRRPLRADHKTVFAVLSWLTFGLLLLGRRLRSGREGRMLGLALAYAWGFSLLDRATWWLGGLFGLRRKG